MVMKKQHQERKPTKGVLTTEMIPMIEEKKDKEGEGKRSMGRQKIPIEKIDDKSRLQVTFSKRRLGLFKKASELCLLCGAEIGIIAFSPFGKAFTFGHPSIHSVLHRFVNNLNSTNNGFMVNNTNVGNGGDEYLALQHHYLELFDNIEAEKKRGEALEKMASGSGHGNGDGFWWDGLNIDGMGLQELEQVRASLEQVKKNVSERVDELLVMAPSSSSCSSSAMLSTALVDYNNACGGIYPYKGATTHDDPTTNTTATTTCSPAAMLSSLVDVNPCGVMYPYGDATDPNC